MKRLASQTSKLKTNMSTQFHFSFTAVNISYCQGQRITGNELKIIKGLRQRNIYMDTKHTKRQTNQIRTTNLKPFYKERMKNKSKTTQKDHVKHKKHKPRTIL